MPNELRPSVPHPTDRSCKTPAAFTYDANGYRRWCVNCGTELGEHAEPVGSDYQAATWVGILLLVLLVVAAALAIYGRNSGGAGVPRGESGGLVSSCETGEPKPTPYPYPGKPVIG